LQQIQAASSNEVKAMSRDCLGIEEKSVRWTIAISCLLILLGLFALFAPFFAGVVVEAVVAWLLIFGGGVHLWLAWHVRGAGAHIWEILIGFAYILAGVFLLFHPLVGLLSLTLVLAVYLFVKGVFELAMGLRIRPVPGSGWLLADAVISILLALLIGWHFPGTAEWVVGTLVGVAILFSGISRLALALAAKKALPAAV
jgi:uncharacterized membrane protein HdeD (DUF308 family)